MIRSVVEQSGLVFFAEAGLVLFVLVFVMVLVNALRRSRSEIHELSHMALELEERSSLETQRSHS